MKIAITVHTYQRPDGQTPKFLKRTLESISKQTYKDFVVILVGDKYEDDKEFQEIVKSVKKMNPSFEILAKNLEQAVEREKYLNVDNTALWNSGGAHALNIANQIAMTNNIYRICHCDHDDYWTPNHLETIVNAIKEKDNPAFLYTLSQYVDRPVFPEMSVDGAIVESFPSYCNLIHSSIYMDIWQLPFEYRDMFAAQGRYFPSDGDMWERIREKCTAENLRSYVIRSVTCIHDLENH